jgi:CheY-like chemotaxis protein
VPFPMSQISEWNVIIVDDEVDNIGVVELVFQFHDAAVRTATSGEECLSLLESSPPSLLLVDIQMPGMSGYELLNKIRERPEWNEIPVVAVTAHTQQNEVEQINAAGFDGYIAKPIDVMTFMDNLVEIVSSRKGQ